MSFTKSINIMKEVEIKILGEKPSIFTVVTVNLLYPFKIVIKGIGTGSTELFKFSFLYIALLFIFAFMLSEVPREMRPMFEQFLWPMVIIVPLFINLFAAPSTFCTYGVKTKYIFNAVEVIKKFKLIGSKEIEAVRNNVQIFEARVDQRIRFLKALLALGWAGFIYIFVNMDNLMAQSLLKENEADWQSVLIIGAMLLVSFIIIEGYSKGCALISKSVIFGLSEYEFCASNKKIQRTV